MTDQNPETETVIVDQSARLTELAKGIRERDRFLGTWTISTILENGLDLLEVKLLTRHGDFEPWCRKNLSYSKSKAEKLMQVAEVFGPAYKSGKLTVLLKATLASAISAPSVPSEIRDKFLPRIIAGDLTAGTEFKAALKEHKEKVAAAFHADEAAANNPNNGTQPNSQSSKGDEACCELHAEEARSAIIDLILSSLGSKVSELRTLISEAGKGKIFNSEVEYELLQRTSNLAEDHVAISDAA